MDEIEAVRYAIVQDGVVVNIILWDGETEWTPPEGTTVHACPDEVGIGWGYVDGVWTAPVEVQP